MPAYSVYFLTFVALFAEATSAQPLPDLPEPVSNNAIVLLEHEQQSWLISFMGLDESKSWQGVHNKVWALQVGNSQWQRKNPVPSSLALSGRLASTVVALNGKAWLFGGYTVAEDHSEVSSPDNYAYDVQLDEYTKLASMPVPVDDAVALAYQNRYIYLISGWHNDGNVNLVQIYDTEQDSWLQGSPFPGKPVFGHAGGIVNDTMIICDGVKVVPQQEKRRTFSSEAACFSGHIDSENITKVHWQTIAHPTGIARYRMAATGIDEHQTKGVIFIGGSNNPYNYNGIGYNGEPASPDDKIWFYDIDKNRWVFASNPKPTMDHRGLLQNQHGFYLPGGMTGAQKVTKSLTYFNKQELLSTISGKQNSAGQDSRQ